MNTELTRKNRKPHYSFFVMGGVLLIVAMGLLPWTVPAALAAAGGGGGGDTPGTLTATHPPLPSILEVDYDPALDLITIQARNIPLAKVLREISKKSSLMIDSPGELLKNETSVELKHAQLEEALVKILGGVNYAFLYFPASGLQQGPTKRRLLKVIITSLIADLPLEASAREESRIDSTAPLAPGRAESSGAALVQAVLTNDSFVAKGIAGDLKLSGKETEVREAAEVFQKILSDKDSYASSRITETLVDILKDLAPEIALNALKKRLQEDSQQVRVIAAAGLGRLGDERAIEPLLSALRGQDAALQQVAASSLARVGGERAMGTLFGVYSSGDNRVRQAVVTAIVSHGDEQSQKALSVLTGGVLPPQELTPELRAEALQRNRK